MTDAKQRITGKQTYVYLSSDLLDRVDAFRHKQLIRPSFTETVRALIERGLNEIENEQKE